MQRRLKCILVSKCAAWSDCIIHASGRCLWHVQIGYTGQWGWVLFIYIFFVLDADNNKFFLLFDVFCQLLLCRVSRYQRIVGHVCEAVYVFAIRPGFRDL